MKKLTSIDNDFAAVADIQENNYRTKSYMNSIVGRAALATEQSPKIAAEVMAVWGDTPTIPNCVPNPPIELTSAQQIATLKVQLTNTDYQIIKCSECQLVGQSIPYDVAALHAERQALRDRINELEATSATIAY